MVQLLTDLTRKINKLIKNWEFVDAFVSILLEKQEKLVFNNLMLLGAKYV